jgi:hypothetical protein
VANRLPASIREVPDSWWNLIMDTGPWYICSDDFELPVELTEFRNFFYRRAQTRRLQVATKISKHTRRLYLQARPKHFYEDPPIWSTARKAPPLPVIAQARKTPDRLVFVAEAVITALRAQGYQIIAPGAGEPEPEPIESPLAGHDPGVDNVKPFNIWDLPIPESWTRSVYTNRLLPPGVPDIKGAIYDDDMSREDMVAAAVESREAAARCTCGTEDLRTHPPSCPVWG